MKISRPSFLRPASVEDAKALAALGRESFCAAFAHIYAEKDLNAFLQSCYSEAVVEQEIADHACIHQLACDEGQTHVGGKLTGYCKLWYPSDYSEYSDAKNPIGLGQLYCDPARTGTGIGAQLMDWAFAEAAARNCDAIQLSVYSENYGAQKFYQRYGFAKIADIHFMVGTHRDEEFLYELRL